MDQMSTDNKTTNTTGKTTSASTSYTINNNQYGWICPVCGRGNAPWNSSCSCRGGYWTYPSYPWWNQPWYVTCNTTAASTTKGTTYETV